MPEALRRPPRWCRRAAGGRPSSPGLAGEGQQGRRGQQEGARQPAAAVLAAEWRQRWPPGESAPVGCTPTSSVTPLPGLEDHRAPTLTVAGHRLRLGGGDWRSGQQQPAAAVDMHHVPKHQKGAASQQADRATAHGDPLGLRDSGVSHRWQATDTDAALADEVSSVIARTKSTAAQFGGVAWAARQAGGSAGRAHAPLSKQFHQESPLLFPVPEESSVELRGAVVCNIGHFYGGGRA